MSLALKSPYGSYPIRVDKLLHVEVRPVGETTEIIPPASSEESRYCMGATVTEHTPPESVHPHLVPVLQSVQSYGPKSVHLFGLQKAEQKY